MRSSGRAAIVFIALVTVLFPLVSPVASAFILSSGPGGTAVTSPARQVTIDEGYNGKSIHVVRGGTLVVQLRETSPSQAWRFVGDNSFSVVSDTVMESYPMIHSFRIKVRGPGDLRFEKYDSLSLTTVETFTVHVVIDEPATDRAMSYPLNGFGVIRPRVVLIDR